MRNKRKRKHITKKHSQRAHAQKRFMERYGIVFDEKLRKRFIDKIQHGFNTKIEDQSHRVKIHLIEGFKVVYDSIRKEIVTVLPNE